MWIRDYRGRGELPFNEIGNFRGQTVAGTLPASDYILQVQADGRWVVTSRVSRLT